MSCASEKKKRMFFRTVLYEKETKEIHGQIIYGNAFCYTLLQIHRTR